MKKTDDKHFQERKISTIFKKRKNRNLFSSEKTLTLSRRKEHSLNKEIGHSFHKKKRNTIFSHEKESQHSHEKKTVFHFDKITRWRQKKLNFSSLSLKKKHSLQKIKLNTLKRRKTQLCEEKMKLNPLKGRNTQLSQKNKTKPSQKEEKTQLCQEKKTQLSWQKKKNNFLKKKDDLNSLTRKNQRTQEKTLDPPNSFMRKELGISRWSILSHEKKTSTLVRQQTQLSGDKKNLTGDFNKSAQPR